MPKAKVDSGGSALMVTRGWWAEEAPVGWPARVAAALGVVTVLPWLYVSVQGLRDDAPDGTVRSMVVLLIARVVLVSVFVASCWPWRLRKPALVAAVVAYAGCAAFAAADNHGSPLLAAVIFPAAPAIAATLIIMSRPVG